MRHLVKITALALALGFAAPLFAEDAKPFATATDIDLTALLPTPPALPPRPPLLMVPPLFHRTPARSKHRPPLWRVGYLPLKSHWQPCPPTQRSPNPVRLKHRPQRWLRRSLRLKRHWQPCQRMAPCPLLPGPHLQTQNWPGSSPARAPPSPRHLAPKLPWPPPNPKLLPPNLS